MKRRILVGLIGAMVLALASVSFAGDRAKGRWQGFAIGLGAVTVYNLFENGIFSPVIPPRRANVHHHRPVVYKTPVYHHPPVVHEPSGHWEIHGEWIPEREEHVWVPGHYENGYWVKGHHEVRILPGYYEERKVWVEDPPYEPSSLVKEGPPPWAPAHGYRAKR
ncbi:MAG: hypothetical protein GTO24_12725 [candidate division Zixibacteria bacterium]|nr:hypothetical protein [candidate division Zixibacteria bacterium]